MSFPRYPEYKDSGVEWLGEVPGHWVTPPVYLRYSVELGKMLDSSRITGDHLVPYLRNVDVQWGRINFDDLPEMDIESSEYGRYTVAPGDLLVCEGGEVGRAAIVPARSGTIGFQKALHRLRASSDDEHPAFMYFTLSWAALRGVFNQSGLSTIAHLTGEQLRKYRFPKPPMPEQATIASFLDRETAKIDTLVAEQQNLIALLREKRQALISHAVTKGLDPDVPMKDSGVAWLGEVPAHWTVAPIKYFVKFRSGGTPSKDRVDYWDGELPWASAKDLKTERLLDTADHISETAIDDGAANLLDAGTVLIVVRGMILARTFPVALTGSRMAINQDLKGLEPDPKLSSEFLALYLRGTAAESLSRLDEAGHGTKALRMDAWASLEVSFPSLDEQVAIAKVVDRETARIDELAVEANLTIALLQERRSALISAAVTGKIDVRRLAVASAAPTPEPA